MIRLYLSNDSYPELREVRSRWDRHRIWWRAFASALGDRRFWIFLGVQLALVVTGLVIDRIFFMPFSIASGRWSVHVLPLVVVIVVSGALSLTWGGDLMRPHLRRVSDLARSACPGCGHQLTGQLADPPAGRLEPAAAEIRCPECGAMVPRRMFEAPYRVPAAFLAVRGRRGNGLGSSRTLSG